MDNLEKQISLNEPIGQVKQLLEARVADYNNILVKLKNQNDDVVSNIIKRLDSISASSMELSAKKKFLNKINRYLSIILYENEDLRLKPEKARLKDIEKLITYFSIIDDVLTKIETKIDNKMDEKNTVKAADVDEEPVRVAEETAASAPETPAEEFAG